MILVVGSGFLGQRVLECLAQNRQPDEQIIATVHADLPRPQIPHVRYVPLDVTDGAQTDALREICRDDGLRVFYFAACHAVDSVFREPEKAYAVNVGALAGFLDRFDNIRTLLFASTDCVYGENDASHPAFREDDPLFPVNEYGRQKVQAEQLVRGHGFTAVRLPYMLGPSMTAHPHFYDRFLSVLRQGGCMEMIDGMTRSVLSYRDAAKLLCALSALPQTRLPSVVNIAGDRAYTKYETGCILAARHGLPRALVHAVTEAEGAKFFADRRASSAVMDNSLLKSVLALDAVCWEEDPC